MAYKGLSASWFPVVLGTLSLALAFYIDYLVFNTYILFIAGKIIFYIDVVFFIFVFASWIYRYILDSKKIKEDYNNITMLSFTAFLGIIYYAFAFFYISYTGINRGNAYLFYYLFIFFYLFVLSINVLLNYNLYTNRYTFNNISYANLVPTIVMGADIILSSVLLTAPASQYYSRTALQTMDFMTVFAFGISFLQFLFIGISAYISHIQDKKEYLNTIPAAMIPVGASSMFIINLLFMPQFNYIGLFSIEESNVKFISVMLWGFDIFLFLVSGLISASHMRKKQSMTVWAYVFPVGISIFADYMLYITTKLVIFTYSIEIFTGIVVIFYIYSWINTYRISRN